MARRSKSQSPSGTLMLKTPDIPVNLKKSEWRAMTHLLRQPVLTRRRIWLAFTVAIAADGLQLLLGPLGWAFLDEITDIVAMILTSFLIGFHLLLLPTFVMKLIPVADMLPTWTGCVAVVVALRRKQQRTHPAPPPVSSQPPDVIDI